MTEEDLAYEALLAVRSEQASDLNQQLVEQCYAIQKKHQFDQDRTISANLMDRLIDKYVDALAAEGVEGGLTS